MQLCMCMLLLFTCAGGKITLSFSELWQFLCCSALSALHWLVQIYQRSCGSRGMARKLSFVGQDQPWLTCTENCAHTWREWQQCRHLWMFPQGWSAHCINVISVTREETGKPPRRLEHRDKLFLSSLDKLPSSSWSQIKTQYAEPEVTEFIICKLCHDAWETANKSNF